MKLHDYLTLKGLTPEAFAEQLQVDAVTVRRYLRGKRRPTWEVMSRITEQTKGAVTANDFVPERETKKRSRPSGGAGRAAVA